MANKVIMPKMGMTMSNGTIQTWLKCEGDYVDVGTPLFEIKTDKVNLQVDSPCSGYLLKIVFQAGETVPVSETIAWIGDQNEDITAILEKAADPSNYSGLDKEKMPPESAIIDVNQPSTDEIRKIRTSPLAKKIAMKNKVDLFKVTGSGPGGRIIKRDIETFLKQTEEHLSVFDDRSPMKTNDIELTGARKIIAAKMLQSSTEKPHVTLNIKVKIDPLLTIKDEYQVKNETKLSLTELLIKITALALKRHKNINATISGEFISYHDEINIGLAVDTENGLIVPVIKNVDQKDVAAISAEVKKLAQKARDGSLVLSDIEGGTFTLTNLGMFGIENFTPIINAPEVAILGVGAKTSAVEEKNGLVIMINIIYLSLSFDHRAVDGAEAARFLQTLRHLIENPGHIWLI
jgi:pyruvate dehydrogenase E2 component (dihydrolipoamide acetyltransferase)